MRDQPAYPQPPPGTAGAHRQRPLTRRTLRAIPAIAIVAVVGMSVAMQRSDPAGSTPGPTPSPQVALLPQLGTTAARASADSGTGITTPPTGSSDESPPAGNGIPTATPPRPTGPTASALPSANPTRGTTPPAPTPRPTPHPTATPVPITGSFALGIWSGQPWEPSRLDDGISLIGRRPAIFMTYQDWGHRPASYLAGDAKTIASRGASWVVTWEPFDYNGSGCQSSYSLSSIASGAHDAFITGWAKAAAAWGGTIYLRFMHEMNGSWYPWGVDGGHCGNTASAFVAAWRHTHDLFGAAGARNVKWVWSPNVRYGSLYPFANLYPGSAYVDWIGLDGYNWGGQVGGHPGWQSLRSIFQATYTQVVGYGKPIMIAETASAQAGGDKAAWIRTSYLSDIPTYLPRVRAVIYFNQRAETDFQLDSSPASLTAFREVAASAAWQGRIP